MSKVNKQKVPKVRFKGYCDNWQRKKFVDCFDIQNGYAYKSFNFVEMQTGRIVLTPGSVALGGGYQANKGRNYRLDAEVPKKFIFKSGDIFITLTDLTPSAQALGYPAIVPADNNVYLHNQRLGKVANSKLDKFFLYNLLRSEHYHKYIVSTASGTTVKHSSALAVLDYETLIPELKEQTAIGNFFQQIDKLIELQTRAVETAETYKKAMLQKMFPQKGEKVPRVRFEGFSGDWREKYLGDIVKVTMGQSPDSVNYTENPSDYILVQGNADLQNGEVVPRIYTTQLTKRADKGDIILTVRAPVGALAFTNFDVVLGRGVAGIKGNSFIYYSLELANALKSWEKFSSGSTFDSINSADIKGFKLLVPDQKEQAQVGNFFQKLDQQIEQQKRKLSTYQQLKKAMLQRMFV